MITAFVPCKKTEAIIQCGDTTLICDRNGQLWDIPISDNTCKNKEDFTA